MSRRPERSQAQASGLALTLVALTAIFAALGYAADRWLGTLPWLMVGGVFVGAALGFVYMVYVLFEGSSRGRKGNVGDDAGRKRSR